MKNSSAKLRIFFFLVLLVVGLLLSLLTAFFANDWRSLGLNLGTEFVGAAITYLLLEWIVGAKANLEEQKQELVHQIHSTQIKIVVDAIEKARRLGWLQNGLLRDQDFRAVHWNGVELDGADLHGASFENASLDTAKLQRALLQRVNFRGAHLYRADMRYADLRGADFRGAMWNGIQIEHAQFDPDTILPDGTNYTPGTDLDKIAKLTLVG
ncbi:MAG: pentapeptide repeat-containing protein [Anaerolineae bacterium]|nr:pentapeptide repeat-containing protein [Anaerolineae bacterium]